MAANLTIQIVGWNSAQELPATLAALATIPRGEAIIRYIDNASSDGSDELVKKLLPEADRMLLPHNFGFAGAHNRAMARCTTPFVMTCDPDVAIDWPGIKELLATFQDPAVGAVQGKLYRTDGTSIDSAGIVLTRALNGHERGAYEEDTGQYDEEAELWAVTGAAGLYRVAALQSIAEGDGQYFDEDFFAYKEDVDVGWRLRRAGWRVLYRPVLMGRHRRTLGRRGFLNWGLSWPAIWERLKSPRTRYSLRNWVWMIVKNVTLMQELKAGLFIAVRLVSFLVLSLLYPPLLGVWPEILRGIPTMLHKRSRP